MNMMPNDCLDAEELKDMKISLEKYFANNPKTKKIKLGTVHFMVENLKKITPKMYSILRLTLNEKKFGAANGLYYSTMNLAIALGRVMSIPSTIEK